MNSIDKRENMASLWLSWHFSEVPKLLLSFWQNYLFFFFNFFSIHFLIATLFSPWRMYRWRYPKGFHIGEFFQVLVSNTFSRIIGAICRIVIIVFGIFFQLFIFIAGLVLILIWILMPSIFIALIILLLAI